MLELLTVKENMDHKSQSKIQNMLGGRDNLINYLKKTTLDFSNPDGSLGYYALLLNMQTHTPHIMPIEHAQYIANEIIIPLYVLSQEILRVKNNQPL